MKLDIIYSFKVMEGMVKHTWKLDIFSSLPHVRGCASMELSRAEEFYGPSLE